MIQKTCIIRIGIQVAMMVASQAAVVGSGEGGVIDLTRPENYANQPVPAYITRDNTPQGNEITNLGATLGRVLFYDKRLSRNNTVSCASCHQQEHAFSDRSLASVGVSGTTSRHSMRLINTRFSNERRFFWDERAATLEDQTTRPIHDTTEMGFSGEGGDPPFSQLTAKLAGIEEYQVMFTAVYGNGGVTENRMELALAQFLRSIQSFDSKYDEGRSQVPNDAAPFPNFTASENAGKQIFLAPPGPGGPGGPGGGAGCAGCHQPPAFDIDPNSLNNGITGTFGTGIDGSVTRSPTLRDLVDVNGVPHTNFMHNAQFATLQQVINHYNGSPAFNVLLDPRLRRSPLNLSNAQKADLEAFLKTLTGSNVYSDPKWSSPFDENGELSIVVLPSDGLKVSFTGVGESRQATVEMTHGVPRVEYLFQWSHDLDEWASTPVTASFNGRVTAAVAAPVSEGHCFYRFAYLVSE
jgi:cytochrome c peroxidase